MASKGLVAKANADANELQRRTALRIAGALQIAKVNAGCECEARFTQAHTIDGE